LPFYITSGYCTLQEIEAKSSISAQLLASCAQLASYLTFGCLMLAFSPSISPSISPSVR
jgi:hypothetical protein